MRKRVFFATICAFIFLFSVSLDAATYYEGKTIRIVVGLSAGGGYDLWARTIARHLGKFIPGNPTVIVENMPGAGSIVAANYIYKAAKPDGLTIGHISGNIFFNQLFGQKGIEFDARHFEYIGAPYQDEQVIFIKRGRGVSTLDEWFKAKKPLRFGGQAPGSTFSDNAPRVLREALGLPIKTISGYKGTAEVKLAMEQGEVDGNSLSWTSGKAVWAKELKTGDIIPILQIVPKPIPEIAHVPNAINYAKTPRAKKLIELVVHDPAKYARPFMLPPKTPREQVHILREAFHKLLSDREFIAEATKARLEIKPATGEELKQAIEDLFALSPAEVESLKELLLK